jgi:hypothetical protein
VWSDMISWSNLMVEPLLASENRARRPANTWYTLAQEIISAIRTVDPTTPVLVSVAPQGSPDALRNLNPRRFAPDRNMVVFAIHNYVSHEYTHQKTLHSLFDCDSGSPLGKTEDRPRQYDGHVKQRMDQIYRDVTQWRTRHRVAVAVNELGVTRWVHNADVFMNDHLRLVTGAGLSYAVWLWDPDQCLGWDAMNFRNGPDRTHHEEQPGNGLARVIECWWKREEGCVA